MTFISIDLGSKSIGICKTDINNLIPIPIGNYFFDSYDLDESMNILDNHIKNMENVDIVLIGMPKKENNEDAKISNFIKDFIILFKSKYPKLKLKEVDERYSTRRGLELKNFNSKQEGKYEKDMLSSYVILKDYLDFHSN